MRLFVYSNVSLSGNVLKHCQCVRDPGALLCFVTASLFQSSCTAKRQRKEKTILFWDYYNQIRRFKGQINRSKYFTLPDETSINAYEQVKVKLCERYAKF